MSGVGLWEVPGSSPDVDKEKEEETHLPIKKEDLNTIIRFFFFVIDIEHAYMDTKILLINIEMPKKKVENVWNMLEKKGKSI